ncbi:MAG: hypothetical protein MHMPM18_004082 [Marteilia pararefringens]
MDNYQIDRHERHNNNNNNNQVSFCSTHHHARSMAAYCESFDNIVATQLNKIHEEENYEALKRRDNWRSIK